MLHSIMTERVTLTLEVPEWVDETRLKEEISDFVKDFSDNYVRAKSLKEIEELNFDEKELEKFEKLGESWEKTKKE